MSTTYSKWQRAGVTLASLLVLLMATGAAGSVPATARQSAAPAVLAPAAICTRASAWAPAATMLIPRDTFAAVAAQGHMFVLGGWVMGDNGHQIADVETAPIGTDGALGAWAATTPLSGQTSGLGAVAINGYVYVVGGWANWDGSYGHGAYGLERVERAEILADGQLGPWEAQESLPLYGRINLAAVATSTQIYALGGWNYSGYDVSSEVERASIHSDGTLGAWTLTSPMLIGRRSFGAVIANNFVYVVGGDAIRNPGSAQSVERAAINADGSLGAWQELAPLLLPRIGPAALVDGGYLYAIAGALSDYQTTTATVERAALHADGSLGPWQYVDPLLSKRVGHSGVSYNGRFYIMGGQAEQDPGVYAQVNTTEQVTASELGLPYDNGLTINDGALFTNQTAVSLTISGRPGMTQMQVSNDGGFAGAEWQACVSTIPWTITQYGNSAIPRVVYVKFKDAEGTVSSTYSDDIILDVTPPTGTVVMTPMVPAGSGPVSAGTLPHKFYLPLAFGSFCAPATCSPNVMLHLSASDDTSGVASMEIGNDPAFTGGPWVPYTASKTWHLPAGLSTVYARFRDNAGNVSSAVTGSLAP